MGLVARAGALHEGNSPGWPAVGWTADAPGGRQTFHLDIGDHVGAPTIAKMAQARGVIRLPSGGLNDSSYLGTNRRAVDIQLDIELAGLAADALDRRRSVNLDLGVLLQLEDLGVEID